MAKKKVPLSSEGARRGANYRTLIWCRTQDGRGGKGGRRCTRGLTWQENVKGKQSRNRDAVQLSVGRKQGESVGFFTGIRPKLKHQNVETREKKFMFIQLQLVVNSLIFSVLLVLSLAHVFIHHSLHDSFSFMCC